MDSGAVQSKEVKSLSSGSKKVRWIVIRNRMQKTTIIKRNTHQGAATPLVKHDASNKKQVNV
jgi:hypothetical protein